MSSKDLNERARQVVRRVISAVDDVLAAAEELKKANAALSLEARKPELKVVRKEDGRDEA
jgi:hypothetical protein